MSNLTEQTREFFAEIDAGVSYTYDAASGQIRVSYGPVMVCAISVGDYKELFGVVAVRRLLHGEKEIA